MPLSFNIDRYVMLSENPCPQQGDIVNIRLSETPDTIKQPDGLFKPMLVDTYFQMNYATGEWKNNKEHGRGVLMTSDRKRIIYSGEFERGRFSGRGIYYYSSGVSMNSKQQVIVVDKKSSEKGGKNDNNGTVQSYYEGDWKENLRVNHPRCLTCTFAQTSR